MVHKCSSSKLPTIQVLRHKLFPEQEKHDFTQTRKHEKTSLASPGALTHRLQRAGEKKMERQITVKIVTNADRSCQYKVNFANTERLKKIQYYIHAKPTQ